MCYNIIVTQSMRGRVCEKEGFIMMKKRLLALLLVLALTMVSCASALAAEAARTLQSGMSGEDVLIAQNRLFNYGYYTDMLDGKFGKTMLDAVKQFQRRNGLTVDGKIGPKTLEKLNSDTAVAKGSVSSFDTLKSGSYGENVKELQRLLRDSFYFVGTVDGIFGSEVTRAVKWFQASANLKVDGKVGAKTWDALKNRTAAIFNGGIPQRALNIGDRGYDVYVLQQKLTSLNYPVSANGYYGADTVSAVKAFQKANGLMEDGKAGAIVRRYLWPSVVNNEDEKNNQNSGTADNPYTNRLLKLGSYGNDVANMQMRLKAAGYLFGSADGIFGKDTEKAVLSFQKAYGLKQDGKVGSQTWALIKKLSVSNAEQEVVDPSKPSVGASVSKLRQGSRGTAVKKLQQQLIQLGYLSTGDDDGKFGPLTTAALKRFQRENQLTVDGVAGTKTYAKLNEMLGVQWDVPVG